LATGFFGSLSLGVIMKALKIVFLISIAVGAVSVAAPAGAAAPLGSYQQSCRQINVVGPKRPDALLTAECRAKNGQWRPTSLYYKNCRGDIDNNNGALICVNDQASDTDGLPPGEWRTACRDGYIDGRTLHADCQTFGGRWEEAGLEMSACPWGPVTSANGVLACDSYQSSYSSLTLYENFDFDGRNIQLTGPVPDLRALNFDRRASSLRVQGTWYVCSGVNYTGECSKVAGAFNTKSKWNDRIFSARPQ
jgi:Beta/Gamma crystallin